MYGANAYNVYKSNSVNLASRDQLLLMILDGAVKFSKISRQAILDKDMKKAHESLVRTQDIFVELMSSLNMDAGEWAQKLMSVYEFINYKLVQANLKKDIRELDEAIPLIEETRDMWYEANKLAKGGI
ncbi:flagellar export chaperone FliS [Clostridium fallax]|uniref:Flagellar secretion chaperone FliS n=1 Tax=Clostridium fallax TaxID=1533 RepID=A0A1M4ULN2_9CLOT|nr:flagellar export chaperone FliS [Clostridium fallax]SHE57626.1 flagellar protein FliS [Clostridium fallax]SQB07633.1 flagellar protein FliS [Clostridium fallax]